MGVAENECGGVLIPNGTRHCFVAERGEHHEGRPFTERELRWSADHFVPRAMGGTDDLENMHVVHKYDQYVQGGKVGNSSNGGKAAAKIIHDKAHRAKPEYREQKVRAAKVTNDAGHRARPEYRKGKVAGGEAVSRETQVRAGNTTSRESQVRAGKVSACTQWNIGRGKPCTCGRHGESLCL